MGPVSDSGGERCWLVGSREVSDTETVTVLADVSPLCALVAELDTETDRLNVLLHEVNHRVKNNLTVVDSLIGMAEQRSSGHADDFHELHNRVRAIRSLHEHLHGSSRQIGIDLPTYLTITLEELFPHACSERIDSSVESPHVEVDSRQALPVALIVVELATNACKHAFSAVEENWFRVRIRRVTNDELEVVVCHNGSRLPSDEAIGASGRSGLQLVRGLVRQLSGSLTIEREPHTRFVIRFPSQHASPSSN
jgi:two-component sensor histidine kinase